MRRFALIPVLCAGLLIAADPGDAMRSDTTVPSSGATAAVIKNANVRFGPSVNAKIAVTLKADGLNAVELIGPAPVKGWWMVRMPRQGRAWVDERNLVAAGEGLWRVTREGTRSREDATPGSSIVRELSAGEIVEERGAKVGAFRAVWIPNAMAYVHESVIDLNSDNISIVGSAEQAQAQAEAEWQEAERMYQGLYAEVTAAPARAKSLNWEPLLARIDSVIAKHRNATVRNKALQIKAGIRELAAVAQGLPDNASIPPIEPPRIADGGTQKPPVGGDTGSTGGATATPVPPPLPKIQPKSPYPAQGILETKDFPAFNVSYVLTDSDSMVVALVRVKPGSTVALSEYIYREVGAKGVVTELSIADTGLGRAVKLIEVEELVKIER